MAVFECQYTTDANKILELAKEHPSPEYDCGFDEFKAAFMKLFLERGNFRCWLLTNGGDKPIGYIAAYRNKFLKNEIDVFDLFVKRNHRGIKEVLDLIEVVKQWAIDAKALRVRWETSHSAGIWSRLTKLPLSERVIVEWRTK